MHEAKITEQLITFLFPSICLPALICPEGNICSQGHWSRHVCLLTGHKDENGKLGSGQSDTVAGGAVSHALNHLLGKPSAKVFFSIMRCRKGGDSSGGSKSGLTSKKKREVRS